MATLARYELQGAAEQSFETLSGGQQARLQVLLLEQAGANLLLLDEPTDNLDLDSAEALERPWTSSDGTVIGVTHDRWFMRTFDRFLYFDHHGDVSEAPDLDAILPVLSGEATVATAGRRLKRLTTSPAPTPAAPAPTRPLRRRAHLARHQRPQPACYQRPRPPGVEPVRPPQPPPLTPSHAQRATLAWTAAGTGAPSSSPCKKAITRS